jgi:transketolase N-terminal domain/subunit
MANPAVKMSMDNAAAQKDMANAIRALAMDAVEKAKSGHPGMPMGMADVATVLFTRFLKFDASAPNWPDRDRFVLSAGHGSMLLYALLHLTGYPGMTMDRLSSFGSWAPRRRGAPSSATRRASRRPRVRWVRASPMRSAWRWPSACSMPGWVTRLSITVPT